MKNLFVMTLFLLSINIALAQKISDTTYHWKLKFGKLAVPNLSPDGRWIAVKKFYRRKPDTVFLYDTQNGKQKPEYILCSAIPKFLANSGIVGLNGNTAEFINLKNGSKSVYPNVRHLLVLNDLLSFALLTKDNKLQLYDVNGQKLKELEDIEEPAVSDFRRKIFVKQKLADRWQIVELLGQKQRIIFNSADPIKKVLLPNFDDKLLIIQQSPSKEHDRLTLINSNGINNLLLELDIPSEAEIGMDTLGNDGMYLIHAKVKHLPAKGQIVDIWYGIDPAVNAQERLFEERLSWQWNSRNNTISLVNDSKDTEILPLGSNSTVLSFVPAKDHNYLTSTPELNAAQLLDLKTGIYRNLGNLKRIKHMTKAGRSKDLAEEIVYSPNGKWFLASENGKNWTLFNTGGEKNATIQNSALELPIFSQKNDAVYFESPNGLWKYFIYQKQLIHMNAGIDKLVKVKNKKTVKNGPTLLSYLSSDSILLEEYEVNTARTGYSLFSKDKWNTLIPPTSRRITDLMSDTYMKSFISLEENYNLPPSLYRYRLGKSTEVLFDGNQVDKEAVNIKQELLSYNALERQLKGILYYPKNFDPSKKYPMVVHIYEVQRYDSNEYLSPNNQMPVGFQIRELLEKGYFVYLPDIVFGNKGTGLSALECVHNALDAVLGNKNIDIANIALIGHSHGGYETNFIATHSDRFKTYISGAGTSDMIRSYYSYNYNFGKPFYFQYETGQYQMGTSIAEDKVRYLQNSPILFVEHVKAPILLWSGKLDENIATDQVTEFYIGLRRYKKDVIALFYPNGAHAFLNETSEEKDLNSRIMDWLDYFLKEKKGAKWIENQMKKDA